MGKLEEAKDILKCVGMPDKQSNDRSALVLLALAGIKEESLWTTASDEDLRIHDIIEFINESYKKDYKENTRETLRKDTLHQFVESAIAERNQTGNVPTNSPKYRYCLTAEMLNLIKKYDSTHNKEWQTSVDNFILKNGTLREKYRQRRDTDRISTEINGLEYSFSSGAHNELQREIIEKFIPTFVPKSEMLYVGDTEKKDLVKKADKLRELGIILTDHDKLPDLILYSPDKHWIIFIEAVTSVGPMSLKRVEEIRNMSADCKLDMIFVTAFPDKKTYKKFVDSLAWETDVWISEIPDHMIHLNGDKFLGSRNSIH